MATRDIIDYKLLGQRIKRVRKSKKITQIAISAKIDVSRQYISGIETGTIAVGLPTLTLIARELNVSLDYLLTGNTPQTESHLRNDMQNELDLCEPWQEQILVELFFDNAKTVRKYKLCEKEAKDNAGKLD